VTPVTYFPAGEPQMGVAYTWSKALGESSADVKVDKTITVVE
jgi:hypothetical protein